MPVEMSRPKKADSGGAWALESATVRVAENGFTVSVSYKKPGDKDTPGDYKSEDHVFEDAKAMCDFLETTLGAESDD